MIYSLAKTLPSYGTSAMPSTAGAWFLKRVKLSGRNNKLKDMI